MRKNCILLFMFLCTMSFCSAQDVQKILIVSRYPVTLISHNKLDTVFVSGVAKPHFTNTHSKMLICRDTLGQLFSFDYFELNDWQSLKNLTVTEHGEIVFNAMVEIEEDGEKSYRLISYEYKEK